MIRTRRPNHPFRANRSAPRIVAPAQMSTALACCQPQRSRQLQYQLHTCAPARASSCAHCVCATDAQSPPKQVTKQNAKFAFSERPAYTDTKMLLFDAPFGCQLPMIASASTLQMAPFQFSESTRNGRAQTTTYHA